MKFYAVHFEDDPTKQSVRGEHQQEHEQFLQRCGERIVNAGVLHREGGATPVGGLWVVRGASELDVRGLIEADPFFVHGLRRTIRLWQFSPSPGAVRDSARAT